MVLADTLYNALNMLRKGFRRYVYQLIAWRGIGGLPIERKRWYACSIE
jgi:hypothetical protein